MRKERRREGERERERGREKERKGEGASWGLETGNLLLLAGRHK
jgi:hypothetical protein